MNNILEQKHLDELYEHEYEEIPNSALYKFNYEEAAVKSAEITADVAIQFAAWYDTSEFVANYFRKNRTYPTMDNSHLIEVQKQRKELFQEFITNHYGK